MSVLQSAESSFNASERSTAELGAPGASQESGGCKHQSSSHPAGGRQRRPARAPDGKCRRSASTGPLPSDVESGRQRARPLARAPVRFRQRLLAMSLLRWWLLCSCGGSVRPAALRFRAMRSPARDGALMPAAARKRVGTGGSARCRRSEISSRLRYGCLVPPAEDRDRLSAEWFGFRRRPVGSGAERLGVGLRACLASAVAAQLV